MLEAEPCPQGHGCQMHIRDLHLTKLTGYLQSTINWSPVWHSGYIRPVRRARGAQWQVHFMALYPHADALASFMEGEAKKIVRTASGTIGQTSSDGVESFLSRQSRYKKQYHNHSAKVGCLMEKGTAQLLTRNWPWSPVSSALIALSSVFKGSTASVRAVSAALTASSWSLA